MENESKKTAGLPVPPPLLMVIFVGVAFLFGWKLPIPIPFPTWITIIGWLIVLAGLGAAFSAVRTMAQAHTSPDPHTPTSALVRQGPYQYSRNPIYLGFVLLMIGLPLIFGYYWGAILSPVLIDAYNRLIIDREETYLESKFGQDYLEYKTKVRRWL